MADYDLPDVVEKRVRYFDGQYLQDQDFIDEQDYQRDREHRQNRLLHGPGIAGGLDVSATSKQNEVQVSPGTAIDLAGFQLVLKEPATAPLPGQTYNGQQGIGLYLSYREIPSDPAPSGPGTEGDTRWWELPELTPALPGQDQPGVLLTRLTLDDSGSVIAFDNSVRSYAGARLPGPAADAVTLRALSSGRVDLNSSLTVNGSPTSIAAQPALHAKIPGPKPGEKAVPLCALQVEVESFGPEDNAVASQLLLVQDSGQKDGLGNYFVVRGDGNVGVGTASPGSRLHVVGDGDQSVDLLVNGQLKSDNNAGGLWVAADRFIGGHNNNQVGFYNGGSWRLVVLPNGNVGIGNDNPENADNWTRVVDVLGSPSTKLSVRTTAIDARIQAHDGGWWGSQAGMVIGTKTGHALSFGTSGATRMAITAGGLVGIGVTSPSANIHLNVTGQSTPVYAQRIEVGNFGTPANARASCFLQARDLSKPATENCFIVRGDGAVGAGTTQLESFLHVRVPAPDPTAPIRALRLDVKTFKSMENRRASYFIEGRDVDGTATLFAVRGDGSVGMGTDDLGNQRLRVAGSTWIDGDLFVTGQVGVYGSDGYGTGWRRYFFWKDYVNRELVSWTGGPAPSDIRLKADVRPIRDALETVRKLDGIRFRWGETGLDYLTRDVADSVSAGPDATEKQHQEVREAERRRAVDVLAGDRMGLVAQDVEAVAPELVFEDEDGYKHIRYQHLTALLVEAVKELHERMRSLSATVATLQHGRPDRAARSPEGK
jgi:hypothetical protein